jgi:hypothetical protein
VAGGKKRLSEPLAGPNPVARTTLNRQGGLKKLVSRKPDAVHQGLGASKHIDLSLDF